MRLFFAIALPEGIKSKLGGKLAELRESGIDASFVKNGQLHITLLFLGEKSGYEKDGIVQNCSKIVFPKFGISVRSAGFFPNENNIRVFWAGAETERGELGQLHSVVAKACGMKPENNFTGHITLARVKSKRNIGELIKRKAEMQNEVFEEFTADNFVLMKSDPSPQGAKYSVVKEFKLK
ncbi:MAG: RNA 2',3'-cyclic phosphodiesterase [Candidatus Micrarchaeota archaeon]